MSATRRLAASLVLAAACGAAAPTFADDAAPHAMSPQTCQTKRAAVSIVGHVGGGPNTFATAMLYPRAIGDAILSRQKDQSDLQSRIRAAAGDPKAMQQIFAEQQRVIEETQAKVRSHQLTPEQVEAQQSAQLSLLSGEATGVAIAVDKNGSFRCDGVAAGAYDLIASVSKAPSTNNPYASTAWQAVIYAARIDVPEVKPRQRILIRANSLARQYVTSS